MADKKEIENGNRLIAEFMGAKFSEHRGMTFIDGLKPYGQQTPMGLKYHISWDWLMKVFEKINENPSEYDISIEARGCWLTFIHEGRVEKAMVDKFPLIECVWLMVVAFITWYNTQSKTNQ